MKISIQTITPELAAKYLAKNSTNRKLRKTVVERYADDMKNGEWQLNGESIRFNKSGELIDGQHRLSAIIKSGKTIEMVVVRDIEDSVSVYDRGTLRTVADCLVFGGMDKAIANGTSVAIAKLHFRIIGKSLITDSNVKAWIIAHEKSLYAVRTISGGHKSGRGEATLSANNAAFYLASLYAYEGGESIVDISEFWNVFKRGLYEGKQQTAAIVFRNDCIARNIWPGGGGPDRVRTVLAAEKAIYDFCRKQPRIKSYRGTTNHAYPIEVTK